MPRKLLLRAGAIVSVVVAATLAVVTLAQAAGSVYGVWTLAGANPAWTGTLAVPANGFPAGTFATNSNTPNIASGTSTFLGPATPFGAVYGTSQGRPYISFRTAAGTAPSTTTLTFPSPTPASGWGFALGDVDADQVQIQAAGPGGPLPVSALGFQSVFNYCGVSPVPPGCTSPPFDHVPTWDPATGTLRGNGDDRDGSSGWFQPTAPITSLTLTFTRLSGIPIFQLWVAALTRDITGTVTLEGGGPLPPGTTVALQDQNGQPLRDAAGNPIVATPDPATGTYTHPAVIGVVHQVAVVPPPGHEVVGPATKPADARNGDVSGVDFVVRRTPPPTTTTTTTTTPTTTAPPQSTTIALPPSSPTTAAPGIRSNPPARPRMPATGTDIAGPTLAAAVLLAVGGSCLLGARAIDRRRRRT